MTSKVWSRFMLTLSFLVVLVPNLTTLGVASASSTVATAYSSDLDGHWSEEVFVRWVNEGWINGYPDGTYKPDKPVKRAEFTAMINRAFKLTASTGELPFKDLTKEHWAYKDIAAAYQAGYFKGANGLASPDRQSTRQEGAVMIAGLIGVDEAAEADLSRYKDGGTAASWAKTALSALSSKGIFKGDTNSNIRPADVLTRAQAITVIDAALKEVREQVVVYDKPGEYGSVDEATAVQGDVVIAVEGVTLVNMEIEGDLLLAKGVGEGDVYLKHVTVKGTTTVQGGGENSVHVEDSVLVRLVVDKASGKVRIVASGSTEVKTAVVQSPVKLEQLNSPNGNGFRTVELAKSLPAKSTVELIGQFENVNVLAASIQINIPSGAIAQLEVARNSADNEIKLGEDATIVNLVLNAIASLAGQGRIVTATLGEKAEGSTFETAPEKLEGPEQSGGVTSSPVIIPGGGGGPFVPSPGVDRTTASLSALQIDGSLSLVQRDANLAPIGTGFSKNVLGYSVTVNRTISAMTVPVTVTTESSAASVQVLVNYKDQTVTEHTLTGGNKTFSVSLKPLEDVQVYIMVTSGDNQQQKNYWISFQYDRTVQEAFLIRQSYDTSIIGPSKVRYYLHTENVYNMGDVVELFEAFTDNAPIETTVLTTAGNLNLLLDSDTYELQDEGRFYLKVKRNGQVVDEGYYEYRLTPIPLIEDAEGLAVRPLTNQERAEKFGATPDPEYPYYYTVSFDPAKWAGTSIENAKYYKILGMSSSSIYYELGSPLEDSFKVDINPYDFYMHRIPSEQYYGFYNFDSKTVYDNYVQLILFDENYRTLGYYQQAIEPGEEHVLPGHTIVHSIRPELNTLDKELPTFTGQVPGSAARGQKLSVFVSEEANVYLVPEGTPLTTGRSIHNLVNGGTGIGARYYVSGGGALLDTTGLALGKWILVAVDQAGNISNPAPIQLVEKQLPVLSFSPEYNTGVTLIFYPEIHNVVELADLKNKISILRDGSDEFVPLAEGDSVTLGSNYLTIRFSEAYTGSQNRVKIEGGSLWSSEDGTYLSDWMSPFFSEGTIVTLFSKQIDAGEDVVFTVDRPATMYLLPLHLLGTGDIDSLVEDGLAKLVIINEDRVNQQIRLSTEGLAPGQYILHTVQGQNHLVELAISPLPSPGNIELSKHDDGVSITVKGLESGSTIRVYSYPIGAGPHTLLQKKTVLPGENSVRMEAVALNAEGGLLGITLQSAGKAESRVIVISYASEEDNYQLIVQPLPVPPVYPIPSPVKID